MLNLLEHEINPKTMKMKNLLVIALFAMFISPAGSYSQTANRQATLVMGQEAWAPVNKFNASANASPQGNQTTVSAPLTNVLNGVSFYSQKSNCNESDVLIKAINVNGYPVKLSWQVGAAAPVESIIIPASREVQGSCKSSDPLQSKLVIKLPDSPDRKELVEYTLSHTTVTPVTK